MKKAIIATGIVSALAGLAVAGYKLFEAYTAKEEEMPPTPTDEESTDPVTPAETEPAAATEEATAQ